MWVNRRRFVSSRSSSYPTTTWRRNFADLSTTSSHTRETLDSSKSVASGKDCSASRDSVNNSLHKSASSPERQARRKNANEKFRAAREPTLARPTVAFSHVFVLEQKIRVSCFPIS